MRNVDDNSTGAERLEYCRKHGKFTYYKTYDNLSAAAQYAIDQEYAEMKRQEGTPPILGKKPEAAAPAPAAGAPDSASVTGEADPATPSAEAAPDPLETQIPVSEKRKGK